ncbi:LOW QUALITY PROTEIN: scavenger receptor cysteine-rich domain-containing protein SCART1 [Trichechus inunguis]
MGSSHLRLQPHSLPSPEQSVGSADGTFKEIWLVKGHSPCTGLPKIRNENWMDWPCGFHEEEATVFRQELNDNLCLRGCAFSLDAEVICAGFCGLSSQTPVSYREIKSKLGKSLLTRALGHGPAHGAPARELQGLGAGNHETTAEMQGSIAQSSSWSMAAVAVQDKWSSSFLGTETHLAQCNVSESLLVPAGSLRGTGLRCSGDLQVLLAGGPGCFEGLVEVLHGSAWGTVCDDSWDLRNAHVVCGQLGCGWALSTLGSAHFGAGAKHIWLDELGCGGKVSALWQCQSRGWGLHDCGHKSAQHAFLPGSIALRLLGGSHSWARWLDVFYNGTWGAVWGNFLKEGSMSIICNQLVGDQNWLENRPVRVASSGTSWLDNIKCRRLRNSMLWQCPSARHPHSCAQGKEVWIACAGGTWTARDHTIDRYGDPQLLGHTQLLRVGLAARARGRGRMLWLCGALACWHLGGTVCDDTWDLADKEVMCRQLVCGQAVSTLEKATFGPCPGPMWLDKVGFGDPKMSLTQGTPLSEWLRTPRLGEYGTGGSAGERDSGPPTAPPAAPQVETLPLTVCIILGTLLGIVSLVLGVQWCRSRGECRGSGMTGKPPSESFYEDIVAIPMGEKDALPRGSGDLVLEEYDDAEEPVDSLLEEPEAEEEEHQQEAALSPEGVHLSALASLALFLLYYFYTEGSALGSTYI